LPNIVKARHERGRRWVERDRFRRSRTLSYLIPDLETNLLHRWIASTLKSVPLTMRIGCW